MMSCIVSWNPLYLLFTSEAPRLLYYSHIPASLISLLIGFFVYKYSKSLVSTILFLISFLFALWSFLNLIVWVGDNSLIISTIWSFFGIIIAMLSLACIYFTHVYITKKDVSLKVKSIWLLLLLPLIIFIKYAASDFDITNCEVIINHYYDYYSYAIGFISFIWIIIFSVIKYRQAINLSEKKQIIYLTSGISAFLISFFYAGFLASYFDNFELEQYGLFGMIIFMVYLAFLIVRFKAFEIKLLGAQALVWALIILIGSQFFFIQSNVNKVLTAITLVISAVVGLIIVRSVKKEVAQREQIEQLAQSLENSNNKLADANYSLKETNTKIEETNEKLKELDLMKSEFVSLATHQIRGPLAAIKGYISLMIEGDYGAVPKSFDEPLSTVFKSTDSLSRMVTDFLDVSRIDLGQMKYEFSEFDFRDLVNDVVKELKPNIDAKGLEFRIKITDQACVINADKNKLKQVLNNLIDNSSKYTKTGWLEVSVENKNRKILFAVKDSGVGISQKTLGQLFQRFSRAKNANDTNILGTGLGLYIAKKMVEANSGKVWAESSGEGKGAQFYVEIPAVR